MKEQRGARSGGQVEDLYRTILADDVVDKTITPDDKIIEELTKRYGGEAVAAWLAEKK